MDKLTNVLCDIIINQKETIRQLSEYPPVINRDHTVGSKITINGGSFTIDVREDIFVLKVST